MSSVPLTENFYRSSVAALTLISIGLSGAVSAHAEGQLRIAEQFGIVYLLLNVAQDQALIEKHGKAQGVDIEIQPNLPTASVKR